MGRMKIIVAACIPCYEDALKMLPRCSHNNPKPLPRCAECASKMLPILSRCAPRVVPICPHDTPTCTCKHDSTEVVLLMPNMPKSGGCISAAMPPSRLVGPFGPYSKKIRSESKESRDQDKLIREICSLGSAAAFILRFVLVYRHSGQLALGSRIRQS